MSKKLADLLNERGQIPVRLADIASRIQRDAVYNEGENVSPNVDKYGAEYAKLLQQSENLINLINRINNTVKLDNGMTLSEALVHRDILAKRVGYFKSMLNFTLHNRDSNQSMYSRMTAMNNGVALPNKLVAFDADELQKLVDSTGSEYRALDSAIQAKNWSTEVTDQY